MKRYKFTVEIKKDASELPSKSFKGKIWNPLGLYYQPRGKNRQWVIIVGLDGGGAQRIKLAEEDIIITIEEIIIDNIS